MIGMKWSEKERLSYPAHTRPGDQKGTRPPPSLHCSDTGVCGLLTSVFLLLTRHHAAPPTVLQPPVCGVVLVRVVGEAGTLQSRDACKSVATLLTTEPTRCHLVETIGSAHCPAHHVCWVGKSAETGHA